MESQKDLFNTFDLLELMAVTSMSLCVNCEKNKDGQLCLEQRTLETL
jgi:hypothetical protein